MIDLGLLNSFCDEGLVYTKSLVIENPIAFPVRPKLASGLSYWILQGDKYFGVSLKNSITNYTTEIRRQPKCDVEFSPNDAGGGDDYAQIMPSNMIFPIIFWLVCAVAAAILQLIHQWQGKKGNKSSVLIGRLSSLELFQSIDRGDGVFLPVERMDAMTENRASERSAPKTAQNQWNDASGGDELEPSRRGRESGNANARRRRVEFLGDVEDDADGSGPMESVVSNNGSRLQDDGLDRRIRHLLNNPSVVDFLHCCLQLKHACNRR